MITKSNKSKDLLVAIILVSITYLLFTVLDANAKYLQKFLPTHQVIWARYIINFFVAIVIALFIGIKSFRSNNLKLQLIRSIFLALTTIFNFIALKYLRLDQTGAIFFVAPIISCILAQIILKEKVGIRRYLAIVVGFIGMLIVINPVYDKFHFAMIISLLSAISFAFYTIYTKKNSASDSPMVSIIYLPIAGVIIESFPAMSNWLWPETQLIWVMLLTLGIIGGLGHLFLVLAISKVEASVIAPFHYQQIFFMVLLGWLYFKQLPTLNVVIGIVIIISSGTYIWYREKQAK